MISLMTPDEARLRRPAGLQAAWEHAEQMVTIYHGRADMARLYYLVALVTLANWQLGAAGPSDWRRFLPVLAFAALAEVGYRQVLRLHEAGVRWTAFAHQHWDDFATATGLRHELDRLRAERHATGSGSRQNAAVMRWMGLALAWVKLLDVTAAPVPLTLAGLATAAALAAWWFRDQPRLGPAQNGSESTGQAPESTPESG